MLGTVETQVMLVKSMCMCSLAQSCLILGNLMDCSPPSSTVHGISLTGTLERWASLVAQLVKNTPAMQETLVRFLGWGEPLENGKATHSSILAWRILWTCIDERVGHN